MTHHRQRAESLTALARHADELNNQLMLVRSLQAALLGDLNPDVLLVQLHTFSRQNAVILRGDGAETTRRVYESTILEALDLPGRTERMVKTHKLDACDLFNLYKSFAHEFLGWPESVKREESIVNDFSAYMRDLPSPGDAGMRHAIEKLGEMRDRMEDPFEKTCATVLTSLAVAAAAAMPDAAVRRGEPARLFMAGLIDALRAYVRDLDVRVEIYLQLRVALTS